ncbi:MAG: hypothetical protein LBN43_03225, partial [Oscillospiraceae bacterium]|nr:hypothetical protein [Oscillospiraceae bacterium]
MEQSNRFTYPKSKLALFREDGEIYLTICRSPMVKLERRKLIRVALTIDNKELRLPEFTSGADKLTLTAPGGEVEFCFEDAACLRIRGCGNLALRFYMDGIEQFENCAPREDGSIEAAYIALGKLLFVPLSGALWHDAKWIPAKAQSEDYSVMLLPSVETNGFECAVHEYFSNGTRSETYKPFDACVTAAARDFAEFQAKFADCGFDPLNIWRQQSETGFFVDKLESTRQFEGFAADYLLSHQSPIRTRAAGDFPVYYHSNETGFPEFAEFPTSAPVKAPDLLTWLALRSADCAESE